VGASGIVRVSVMEINGVNIRFNPMKPNEIFCTYDASIFKRLLGNRDITETRKNKVRTSLNTNGQLPMTIVVNERMEIIDGQARVEVFGELGLPILYEISPGLTVEDCIALNRYTSAWKPIDYVKSFAEKGNKNYVRLLDLINNHPVLTMTDVVCAVTGICGIGNARKLLLESGKLVLSKSFALDVNEMLAYMEQFKLFIEGEISKKKIERKSFRVGVLYQSIAHAYRIESVNNDRLFTQFKKLYKEKWTGRENISGCLDDLTEIYNYDLVKRERLNLKEEERQMKDVRQEKWAEGSWRKHPETEVA